MLIVSNVSAGYGGRDVIFDIDFNVDKGESLAIIGPNGCGKTTLLRAIAGLIKFSGSITIDGLGLAQLKPRQQARRLALLSQLAPANFAYSVYDTVMMGRYAHLSGLLAPPGAADREMVQNCLNVLDLADLRHKPINTLSGGQLQRVYLARALAQDPDIILLDEPTNHLDLKYQFQLIDYLKNWAVAENKTIIGVLHDINLARYLTENMLVLKGGRIAAKGPAAEILSPELLQDVYEMDVFAAMKRTLALWA
jgi:iron complex transport system ATP-binding protein